VSHHGFPAPPYDTRGPSLNPRSRPRPIDSAVGTHSGESAQRAPIRLAATAPMATMMPPVASLPSFNGRCRAVHLGENLETRTGQHPGSCGRNRSDYGPRYTPSVATRRRLMIINEDP